LRPPNSRKPYQHFKSKSQQKISALLIQEKYFSCNSPLLQITFSELFVARRFEGQGFTPELPNCQITQLPNSQRMKPLFPIKPAQALVIAGVTSRPARQ
jgi:hypothetical protein